jgi:hypothetical protein
VSRRSARSVVRYTRFTRSLEISPTSSSTPRTPRWRSTRAARRSAPAASSRATRGSTARSHAAPSAVVGRAAVDGEAPQHRAPALRELRAPRHAAGRLLHRHRAAGRELRHVGVVVREADLAHAPHLQAARRVGEAHGAALVVVRADGDVGAAPRRAGGLGGGGGRGARRTAARRGRRGRAGGAARRDGGSSRAPGVGCYVLSIGVRAGRRDGFAPPRRDLPSAGGRPPSPAGTRSRR